MGPAVREGPAQLLLRAGTRLHLKDVKSNIVDGQAGGALGASHPCLRPPLIRNTHHAERESDTFAPQLCLQVGKQKYHSFSKY